jgi:hypothetical protein
MPDIRPVAAAAFSNTGFQPGAPPRPATESARTRKKRNPEEIKLEKAKECKYVCAVHKDDWHLTFW